MEDEQVMLDVRGGDVGKLELLFDRHHRALFRYFLHLTANRAVSEDLVQEVFFRMLKYRHTYQPGTRFCAWMFQVGRHVHLDPLFARRIKRLPQTKSRPGGRPQRGPQDEDVRPTICARVRLREKRVALGCQPG